MKLTRQEIILIRMELSRQRERESRETAGERRQDFLTERINISLSTDEKLSVMEQEAESARRYEEAPL